MEPLFRCAVAVLLIAALAIRIPWHQRAGTLARRAEMRAGMRREGRLALMRPLLAIPWLITTLAYMLAPGLLDWSQLPVPAGVRAVGVPLGLLALVLLVRVHRFLGSNFSGTLTLQPGHQLVMDGPYRWIRHPMYVAFLLNMAALALLTANVLIAGFGFAALGVVIVLRTPLEEEQLRDRFGAEYEAYRERTGLLLPRWRRARVVAR